MSTELPAPHRQAHCLLDVPQKRVQQSPGLLAFILSGGGGSLSFLDLLPEGRQGLPAQAPRLTEHVSIFRHSHLSQKPPCGSSPDLSAPAYPPP